MGDVKSSVLQAARLPWMVFKFWFRVGLLLELWKLLWIVRVLCDRLGQADTLFVAGRVSCWRCGRAVFVSLSLGVWILSKAEDLRIQSFLGKKPCGLVLLQCRQVVAHQRFAGAVVDSIVPRFQLLIMHEDCSVSYGYVSTCVLSGTAGGSLTLDSWLCAENALQAPRSMNNDQNMHVCWRLVRVLACVWCRVPQKRDRFMIHALCSALDTTTNAMVWQCLQSVRQKKRQHNQEPEDRSSQYSKLPSNMLGSARYKNPKAVASLRGRATWVFTWKYVSLLSWYLHKERPLYTV